MQPRIQEETERYTKENQRRKRWQRVISMLTCIIVFCTTYALILPAITMSGEAACGMTEHTHSEECYALAETLEHVHTVNCTETVCSSDIPICGQEEHTHTLSCYADASADLETAEIWERTMARADMSGGTASDLLAVAWTQVGYKESEANYIVLADGATVKGYTRYGQWNGTPYEDWSELFVKFCLYYAGISQQAFPRADGSAAWRSTLAYAGLFADGTHTPEPGDLIFLTDHVGIVSSVSEDGYVTAIFGDYQNEVRTDTFTLTDPVILGYGMLPELENSAEKIVETETVSLTAEIEIDLIGNTVRAEDSAAEETEPEKIKTPSSWSLLSLFSTLAASSDDDTDTIPDNQNLANHMSGDGNGISIQYKESSGSNWTDLTGSLENLVVGEEFLVQFTINYTLSGGTLSPNVNTMYYQLPINQLLEARSGNVRDSSGSIVGTYTIDTNGLVTVTFLDYYVNQNAAGSEIAGSLSFTSDIYSFDTDGDYKVKLEETSGNYIEVTLKRTIENDLAVDKTAGTVDLENGTVTYTIKVSSNSGTSDEVVLTDIMSNGAVDGSFTVVDKNGNPVNVTAPSDGSTNFTLTLPQMAAGDTYTITYTAKLTSVTDGQTNMTNAVTVKSNLGDDKTLTGSDEITVPFNYSFGGEDFTKSYTANSDGTLTWTVTINADDFPVSLKDWTLSDTFNGEALASQVTIQFTDGTGTYTGTLPYQFTKDHSGTITVTYTTSADYGLGMNGAVNKAALNPPDGSDTPEYPTYDVDKNYLKPGDYWVYYNPLDKQLDSAQAVKDDNGTYGILTWTLTIDNEDSTLAAGWVVKDALTGDNDYDHYYTPDQEAAIKTAIVNALTELYGTVKDSDYELTFWGGYGTYPNTGFTLTVYKPLEKGQTFTIKYSSTTAAYESTTQHYTNVANLNGKVWASDTYTHYPLLLKVDGNSNSHSATSYDLNYLSTGLVNWRVYISPTKEMADAGKDLIVIEDIPDDPELKILQFNGQTFSFAEGSTTATVYVTVNGTSYGIVAEQTTDNGNKIIKITIPKEIVAYYVDQRITISVEMDVSNLTLNNPVSGATDLTQHSYKVLDNKVTIYSDGDESNKTEDSQEQTVYKPGSTGETSSKDETLIKKTTEGMVDGYVLPYVITINAGAEDLDSESDWLQVDDELKFTNWNVNNSRFTTALDTSDVYITLYNADGSVALPKTNLVALAENETPTYPGGFVYTQESEWMYGNQEYVTSTINFTIPDGYKAVLEYQYAFYGKEGDNTTIGISNTSVLHKTGTKLESATSGWYKITESDAQANLRSINIYKVDAYNYSIHLAGAEYDLYKYVKDAATGEWKYEYIQHITSNGLSELEIDTISVNTAYFLIETKAPAGYILDESIHYFMIRDDSVTDDDGNVTYYAPSDFPSGAYYDSGGIIYITNERYTDKITVNKQWYDASGNLLAAGDIPEGTSIELKLYQVFSNYPVDFNYGTIGTDANLVLKVGKYSYTEELLSDNVVGNTRDLQIGDTITITYTFKEAPITDIPGLIHVQDLEYNQIPFTVSQDDDGNTVYTFRYRITDANTTLQGHIGEMNVANLVENGIKWYVDTHFENADHARSVSTYQYVTLSAENNWAHTFYDLPAYLLSENGQIQGYYSYYVNEISSSLAGYTPTYSTGFSSSTSIQNGTIVIENKPPTTTELSISKQWDTQNGAAPDGVPHILVDLYRIAESTNQDQRYVDINFYIGTWSGQSDYYTDHIQVEAGSTVRLTMKLKGGNPLIASDASSIPLTETVSGPDAEGYTTYMYTFVATSDVNIRGHVGTTTRQNAAVTIVDKPDRTVVEDALYIKGIQISNTAGSSVTTEDGVTITYNGNWSVTITGLPTVGMTENGNPLYYSYYIKEDGLANGSFTVGDTTYFPTYQAEDNVIHHESPTVTGGALTVINTPVSDEWIEFEVVKLWVDAGGNVTDPAADSIEFKIWQTDTATGDKKLYKTVTLTAADDWKSGTLYVPSSASYTYTVEEIGDYNVTYSYTAASEGTVVEYITDGGTVTIQNMLFTTVLPTTGGSGTLMYTLGGLALCGWTVLQYNKKRGRKGVPSP